jgi:hypothetical protein
LDRWIRITKVLDRWHQQEGDAEWPAADYFKVQGDDECDYLLKHDRESDTWYLIT